MTWKCFSHYLSVMRRIFWSPVCSLHKGSEMWSFVEQTFELLSDLLHTIKHQYKAIPHGCWLTAKIRGKIFQTQKFTFTLFQQKLAESFRICLNSVHITTCLLFGLCVRTFFTDMARVKGINLFQNNTFEIRITTPRGRCQYHFRTVIRDRYLNVQASLTK